MFELLAKAVHALKCIIFRETSRVTMAMLQLLASSCEGDGPIVEVGAIRVEENIWRNTLSFPNRYITASVHMANEPTINLKFQCSCEG